MRRRFTFAVVLVAVACGAHDEDGASHGGGMDPSASATGILSSTSGGSSSSSATATSTSSSSVSSGDTAEPGTTGESTADPGLCPAFDELSVACLECASEACASAFDACCGDPGCAPVAACAMRTGCVHFECYDPDVCQTEIDAAGGPMSASIGLAAGWGECMGQAVTARKGACRVCELTP
ncbi:MAG: hypothetical protein KUG77_25960 [Nannocystaceae bacterium]|nr:hypothetical protein [Nannocystaceae bacterium]